ncbi:hypothetical protein LO771_21685 [Streptacidiphilus sp. ASG 303]|uniref:hypothetical protein n=1 Tax=Streptacidiphilus sp. ASG 303 TaxID=2896847 RepID=UPI001E5246BD|nr:hypothetical protein [Streptacidiphilus sp. ASG 303]MCD0484924.1 hypothetical protein [Streptacidiphilus sp. ASG 303]
MSFRSSRSRRLKALLGAAPLLAGALVVGPTTAAHAAPQVRDVNFEGSVSCAKFKDLSVPTVVRVTSAGFGSDSGDVTSTGGVKGTYGPLTLTLADSNVKVSFQATCDPPGGGALHTIKKNATVTTDTGDGDTVTVNLP